MRKLNIDDTFAFSEILDKMDIQADINAIYDEGKKRGIDWAGGQIVFLLVKKMHKAKEEVIALLASIHEIDIADLRKYGLFELKELITQIVNNEDFGRFFQLPEPNEQK